jgi:hypothetical protein
MAPWFKKELTRAIVLAVAGLILFACATAQTSYSDAFAFCAKRDSAASFERCTVFAFNATSGGPFAQRATE